MQHNTNPFEAADIGASAVTTAKINDLAVTTGKINDLAVTAGKIAADAVTTAKILDANVTAAKLATPNQYLIFPFSVMGAQTAATLKQGFVVPAACTIVACKGYLNTAPTGATTFKVDINKNGTTIFTTQSNRLIWVASATAATDPAALEVTSLAAGDFLSIDVDAVGSTIAGSDLAVTVIAKLGLVA